MKNEFYFPSKDGNTEIHTVEWKPKGEVKAVLQMCHGMVEYIDRYYEFALFLCERGFMLSGMTIWAMGNPSRVSQNMVSSMKSMGMRV